jgi:deoxyribose-phosphate aldolase|tara:strand:+ start:2943 stop:3803 length:861 start_codon:yes stop_codon:yes gene_type:complete
MDKHIILNTIDEVISSGYIPKEDEFCECPHCDTHSCPDWDYETVKSIIFAGADRIGSAAHFEPRPEIAGLIDHTLLAPSATLQDVRKLCQEAKRYCFISVCVNPSFVKTCVKELKGSGVKVATVIGFPLGATSTETKCAETKKAAADGADELDMVIHVGMLREGDFEYVENDIRGVVNAAEGRPVKVILETSLLSDDQKVKGAMLAKWAGANFVKTSTGFSTGGATVADVALLRKVVGKQMGVKASGGIKTYQDAVDMVASGASRIGASASIAIATGKKPNSSVKY